MLLNFLNKYKGPALLIGLALCLFYWWPKNHKPSQGDHHLQQQASATPGKSQPTHNHGDHGHAYQQESETKNGVTTKPLQSFQDFEHKRSHIESLIKNYPSTKESLMVFINEQDPYRNHPVKPHTIDSVLQMKTGALKVHALQSILKREKRPLPILEQVIAQAKDHTLKKIAQAAIKSHQSGRSLFKDFVEGVERMPIPQD